MSNRRIVVVGCGSIGRRHARLLSDRKDLSVEICERSPEHLNRALEEVGNVPTHPSFKEMLETKPEMVVIATPHSLHAEQSVESLRAGSHVLCEKPMSHNLAEAKQMVSAVENSDRVFSVGFTFHFHPVMLKIRDMIKTGVLGELLYLHFHIGTYLTLMNSVSRHQAEVEGAIAMDYAHQPDLYCWWLNKLPTSVYAVGIQGGKLPLQSNPNVMAIILEYEQSPIATIHLNYVQHPDRGYCEIVGEKGWVFFDSKSSTLRIGMHEGNLETTEEYSIGRDSLYVTEHQVFLDAIAGKRTPESPAQESIRSMQIVEATLQSWKNNARINLSSD